MKKILTKLRENRLDTARKLYRLNTMRREVDALLAKEGGTPALTNYFYALISVISGAGPQRDLDHAMDQRRKLSDPEKIIARRVEIQIYPGMKLKEAKDRNEPLYISRPLLNTEEFTAWAKKQGFQSVTSPEKIHATLVYSKEAVPWEPLSQETNELTVRGASGKWNPSEMRGP